MKTGIVSFLLATSICAGCAFDGASAAQSPDPGPASHGTPSHAGGEAGTPASNTVQEAEGTTAAGPGLPAPFDYIAERPFRPALPEPTYVNEGLYLQSSAALAQLGGDFNDNRLSGPDVILLPQTELGGEYGLSLGYRPTQNGSGEMFYRHARHPSSSAGVSTDVTGNTLGFGGAYYFRPGARLQPFLGGEFGYTWFNIDQGSTGPSGTGDGKLSGATLGVHGGLQYHLDAGLSLDFFLRARWVSIKRAKGVEGRSEEVLSSVYGQQLAAGVGLTYRF